MKLTVLGRMLFALIVLSGAVVQSQPAFAGGTTVPITNLASGAKTLNVVPVANAGNPADTNGLGKVTANYSISEGDITVAQYVAFLNAVAKSDPYGLYCNDDHWGIARTGQNGSYHYTTQPGTSGTQTWADLPVTHITWGAAARFCNWLTNGQPTGAEGAGTTETGSYALNGAQDSTMTGATRNANAKYVLPTLDEWYKAAYYGGPTAGYYRYPTGSNTAPNAESPKLNGANSANFNQANLNSIVGSTTNFDYYTAIGAYTNTHNFYGTYDQGGNVSQWIEGWQQIGTGAWARMAPRIRGASWEDTLSSVASSSANPSDPNCPDVVMPLYSDTATQDIGFRIVMLNTPEPMSLAVLGLGAAGAMWRRRRA